MTRVMHHHTGVTRTVTRVMHHHTGVTHTVTRVMHHQISHSCHFRAQAVGGLLAHDVYERLRKSGVSSAGPEESSGGSAIAARFLDSGSGGPELVARASEAIGMWKQVGGKNRLPQPQEMTALPMHQYSTGIVCWHTVLSGQRLCGRMKQRAACCLVF